MLINNLALQHGFRTYNTILSDAKAFLALLQEEQVFQEPCLDRIAEIESEVEQTGTYWQSFDELAYGAKLAWRNSTRCVGRSYWNSLEVRDRRSLNQAEEIFEALVEHLRLCTNGGRIKSLATVFAPQEPGKPGIRIWNDQLIRYAGYRQPDGSVVGDPKYVEFTELVQRMGWKGGEGTPFDILPIVIQMPNQRPKLFELPRDAVLEVPIQHPDYSWFAELGLKWHALPAICNMMLEIGGVQYTAAPFSGWYMGTEIAARNFADENRYNLLPVVAKRMGLDTRYDHSLWRDRAIVELNVAVLYSFRRAGVTMVDHHSETRRFVQFEKSEALAGRTTYADWGWIVPPISGSTTPVFHRNYENVELKPNFFSQPDPWRQFASHKKSDCPFGH
ncbi:nitric oxide synthase oxygenase [Fischerella thermalis CCMEE 5273]|uniref:Nitric oxide synthase oxygenase n=1 Tax=Chlorogloeopsis fritschii PCC 6912 TaxID=211165 RepID=A0A3S0Y4D0_CHLFR|nr:nitric oxide synthase oxygenase [Chlorogloeopsis fritschii]PMB05121.1 nitric oxide synthase oxygenase [Fischerella thermalis CCMEE 5273]PMB49152.1 nitric oxide synthase oxygenase [Fischerella thermalis CCMEE 5205]RUR83876.1 nitric oxide synthase oxygenase [Chlorogloeopsis fritschii PCC 6912]